MNMAEKKGVTDTVKTFCNQIALNEQTENLCWRSPLLYSMCLFREDLHVGFISPYSKIGSCQLLWSCSIIIFSPTKVSTWWMRSLRRSSCHGVFIYFFSLSRVSRFLSRKQFSIICFLLNKRMERWFRGDTRAQLLSLENYYMFQNSSELLLCASNFCWFIKVWQFPLDQLLTVMLT